MNITPGKSIVIGAVRVNKPQVFVDKGYECAAWSETRESLTGIFPVRLEKEYHFPHHLYAEAVIDAKVTDDYFPALWGGVAISREPYKPKHIGEERTIRLSKSLVEAIKVTGTSPSPETTEVEWFLNPEFWMVALEEASKELNDAYERLPEFWAEYKAGENEYDSRISMVAHCGEILGKRGREIEEIRRQMKYLHILKSEREKGSDMWIRLHNTNTAWAREFLKLPDLALCPSCGNLMTWDGEECSAACGGEPAPIHGQW